MENGQTHSALCMDERQEGCYFLNEKQEGCYFFNQKPENMKFPRGISWEKGLTT